jgi:hypothetical protein
MSSQVRTTFVEELKRRFGDVRKREGSESLYEVGRNGVRVYIRYSRVHNNKRGFYGLRQRDLQELDGHPSVVCFLWDDQMQPLVIPFVEYEELFHSLSPASDGQFKVMVYPQVEGTQLYVNNVGRFSVEAHFGWDKLETMVNPSDSALIPNLSHSQVQTLLGAIGCAKGFDIWVPQNNRASLDWTIARRFDCCAKIPLDFDDVEDVAQEIDVMWVERGSNQPRSLFEVEHSTPIYSGLLRFNDIHLTGRNSKMRFSIVANDARRSVFARQLNRPTFRTSGLSDLCTFFEYGDVFAWHNRVAEENTRVTG